MVHLRSMTSEDLIISRTELKLRLDNIRGQLKRRRFNALYLTNPTRVLYTTGFSHISTERPLSVVIPAEGPIFFMGPQLECDHVKQEAPLIEEIYTYPDYPGKTHPIRRFARILADKGFAKSKIATDSFQGAAGGYGYRGPGLSDILKQAMITDGREIVDNMRLVKSKQEIRLLRESAKWSQVAHDILLEKVKPGSHDVLVGLAASYEGLTRMLRKIGHRYIQLKFGLSPVIVGFRGQVGANSAIPHSVYSRKKIRKGDVLITEAGVEIGGYTSELERTVFVGKPSQRSRKYFDAMLKAQDAAFAKFRAGIPCSSVDKAAHDAIEKLGLGEAVRHHTGHGIGLEGHEPPWLDLGDRTIIRAGMVFSCEPGLYVPGYAGFRHSDTLSVSKNGMNLITEYPRSIEQLTV
jgi:Xaa-Pro aminopeptidase